VDQHQTYSDLAYTAALLAPIITLALLYFVYGLGSGTWSLPKIWEGYDGQASTSKFQFFLWTVVIFAAYVAIFAAKAAVSSTLAITTFEEVPKNILVVLGFSIATAATAKGITASYVSSGRVSKGASSSSGGLGSTLQDDTGAPDLSKIQMIGWTFVAIAIYVYTVYYQVLYIGTLSVADVHSLTMSSQSVLDTLPSYARISLPDIDPSLLVLMGLGQGAYLGKKLVTTSTPRVTGVSPSAVQAAANTYAQAVAINGTGFGANQAGNQITLDGGPFHGTPSSWTDSCVQFAWPTSQASGAGWVAGQVVSLGLLVDGQSSNSVPVIIAGGGIQPVQIVPNNPLASQPPLVAAQQAAVMVGPPDI
jgi:hypothetical protein